ncbi:MAG: lysylphosphatidylglycerol synthase domain-containing protein [candidate division WOR-3 bacterium]
MVQLNKKNKLWRTVVAIIIIVSIFFFMGRSLYHNWDQVKTEITTRHFQLYQLILAFLFLGLNFLIGAYGWKCILSYFAEKITFKQSIQIIAYALLGKYLPGKVWAILGRIYLAKEIGIAERHSALSVVIETAYLLISAFALFLISLLFYPSLLAKTYLLLILIPITVILIFPPIFNRVVNFLLVRLKQQPVSFNIKLNQAVVLFLLYLSAWVAAGIGLYFLIIAFYPLDWKALFIFPGAFSLSWIIGFVVIFAPGGLGVREGLFALLIDPIVPKALNILISFLSRIWITISEILIFLFVFIFFRFRRIDVTQKETRNQEIS